jgi:hypothetical protein
VQPSVSVISSEKTAVDLDGSWAISAAAVESGNISISAKAVLLGTTIVTTSRGIATFTDLRIDVSSKCYAVRFSLMTLGGLPLPTVSALSVVSLPFEVSTGYVSQIVILRQVISFLSSVCTAFICISPSLSVSLGSFSNVAILFSQPAGIATGKVLETQPIVAIADAVANLVTADSWSTVTAELINTPPDTYSDPNKGLLATPDSSFKIKVAEDGVAAFSGLIVTAASGCLRFRFYRLGLRSAEGLPFVTVPAAPQGMNS